MRKEHIMVILTTEQVATRTGICEATLKYWREAGEGPRSWKIGRRTVYDEADVLAWLEAQKEQTSRGGMA